MNKYHDGPTLGVADYAGEPHIYQAEWNGITEEYGAFRLAKIESELLQLVLEDWAIWLRWQSAFHQKLTSLETHPALPPERKRHEELTAEIGNRLCAKPGGSLIKRGEFRGLWDGPVEVCWRDD